MGTILASAIITKARDVLQDSTAVRWLDAEALRWLNEGQRYIALARPDASSTIGNITLAVGTKQVLPSGGLRLLDVKRNMGVGGATPGAPIRFVAQEILDSQVPDWHSQTAVAALKHFTFDERSPKNFYVFPPSVVSNVIEALYSVAPADIASVATAITLDDIYEPVLLDYLLYRCYLKDAEYAGDGGRAVMHVNAVNAALGIKTKIDLVMSPVRNSPGNPNATKAVGGVAAPSAQ